MDSLMKHSDCAPPNRRQVERVTGDPDFDYSITMTKDKDVPARLRLYILTDEPGYGPRTGYDGYSGYSGDD